jgi:hypothetical protein
LRDVTSLRDFIAAVEAGAATAHEMLNDVERRLLDVIRAVDQDAP